jgi:hypothetical protein
MNHKDLPWLNLRGRKMVKWTTEPPTKPGWYWVCWDNWVTMGHVYFLASKPQLICEGRDYLWKEYNKMKRSLEPIPEPETEE